MTDHGIYATAHACGQRVGVPTGGMHRWRNAMCPTTHRATDGSLAAVSRLQAMFGHAVRGPGANSVSAVKRHQRRPSERLM